MSEEHYKNKAKAYWEGKSSQEDEAWLKNTPASESHKDAAYFSYLKNQQALSSSRKFEAPAAKRKMYMQEVWQYAAAACFVFAFLLTAIFAMQNTRKQQDLYASRQIEAQYAFNTTKEALLLISGKINAGAEETSALGKIHVIQQLFDDQEQ